MAGAIRVFLVDDHPTLRIGLRALLGQALDIVVVGEANNGQEALRQLEILQPDVVVLDYKLSDMEGMELACWIRRRGLPIRVLVLSSYDEDRYLAQMWSAGAMGYLPKEETPWAIVAAVRAAAKGWSLWTPSQLARIERWREEVEQRWRTLTEREREVLRLMVTGKSNKEIARALGITERTVEFHVGNLLSKLGAGSRVEAVIWAKAHGWEE